MAMILFFVGELQQIGDITRRRCDNTPKDVRPQRVHMLAAKANKDKKKN